MTNSAFPRIRSTTVLCVRRDGRVAMVGEGQVTLGETILKSKARKVRRLYKEEVLAGFAGATSDAFALFDRFEKKLEEYRGNLRRASVELSREWRTDRALRRLEAFLIVANKDEMFLLSGSGDVVEPDDDILAIGSGGPFALSAAIALAEHSALPAREIATEALRIAARICVFSNDNLVIEEI
ncbi:ATP-dependent protease subunit HslV [Acidobacteriota bacterium]